MGCTHPTFKSVRFAQNTAPALTPGARRDDPGEGRHAGQNRAPCHVNRDHLPVPVAQGGEVGELVGAIGQRAKGRPGEESVQRRTELCLNMGDAHHQAARFSVSSVTSTPSLNLIPSMTFGNWFLPLSRSHFFDAA